ncbi:FtsW/RodA/SpoVE family cell cycle protein [Enterococcus raffinosus]|uniref:FtsW/RodA/SpoVE family cell cycle protein n=1 Tax=Enterococcus raffinosus TaxID=71452 RepID=A0AAW8T5F0_9ENTE|nr:FtsW/RodA/SpoVE family cell cycle protein [Enterococcus raffinosus]MDT2522560.1 FtsW/RodA/SpoVE family cell cycle protein [Enterococcus raffinosus]MDT2531215.1 FtsW/RodA/SpoVE family cell cycle protein [Enterococcus raffinosus]MDT2533076.1 FtsW/RodA/SpoVE family cell cycle protein [Enterococcus raffinosus]MDT2543741.1 FtsW/RodA/SpoVE family cell cycle protein [Enterococcus raffinosus]MDT2555123.1 FtsW/RodA/SpoVE family cell cycle protein [Enterococcus raffinosus]
MIKRLSSEFNYSLFLPIFIFYLISIGVQSMAAELDGADVKNVVTKQIIFCLISLLAMGIVSKFKTATLLKYAPFFYVVSLGIMALLYWFYDPAMYTVTNTKRWLRIGGFSFQPSELMKLSFTLFMVRLTLIDELNCSQRTLKSDLRYLGKVVLFSLPTFFLMFIQRDFGTSLVFIAILGALFVISGVHWKILTTITGIGAALGASLLVLVFSEWGNKLLYWLHFKTYQLDRVRAWVDPFQYRDSIAYQQVQSLYAIGSGGLFGRGSEQASVYVPVRESDMIFTVIGEGFGFIGSTLVVFLYFYLFYQIISAAMKTNNKGNLYLAVTFVFGLLFQIFENIGAAIGILPLTGIPLPILSQGGTSLIVLGVGLGIMMGFKEKERLI